MLEAKVQIAAMFSNCSVSSDYIGMYVQWHAEAPVLHLQLTACY